MEGTRLALVQTLLKPPNKFKQHHFSNPRKSVVIPVERKELGTETRKRETHTIGRADGTLAPPKALSQLPEAIRKRNSRNNPRVREREGGPELSILRKRTNQNIY